MGVGLLVILADDTWVSDPVVLGVAVRVTVAACEPVVLEVGASDGDCENVPPGVIA